jgi:hypothetical protein
MIQNNKTYLLPQQEKQMVKYYSIIKIRCLSKGDSGLTYGKVYKSTAYSRNNDGSVAYWDIIDDNGFPNFVSGLYFMEVDKFRDEQIDKILK